MSKLTCFFTWVGRGALALFVVFELAAVFLTASVKSAYPLALSVLTIWCLLKGFHASTIEVEPEEEPKRKTLLGYLRLLAIGVFSLSIIGNLVMLLMVKENLGPMTSMSNGLMITGAWIGVMFGENWKVRLANAVAVAYGAYYSLWAIYSLNYFLYPLAPA
jgi:hypothetical protein